MWPACRWTEYQYLRAPRARRNGVPPSSAGPRPLGDVRAGPRRPTRQGQQSKLCDLQSPAYCQKNGLCWAVCLTLTLNSNEVKTRSSADRSCPTKTMYIGRKYRMVRREALNGPTYSVSMAIASITKSLRHLVAAGGLGHHQWLSRCQSVPRRPTSSTIRRSVRLLS